MLNKKIPVILLFFFSVNAVIGFLLIKSRSFSHLALWNITQSNREDDFYWPAEKAPAGFRFQTEGKQSAVFRDPVFSSTDNEKEEFSKVLKIARYLFEMTAHSDGRRQPVRWGSPVEIWGQVQRGATANCFYRSILFSTFLAGHGIKSRLWALENSMFNGISHTITEVYLQKMRKWIFVDTALDFYATDIDNRPLSLLELRKKILSGNQEKIVWRSLSKEENEVKAFPVRYYSLVRYVFLRMDNDYSSHYSPEARYGLFSFLHRTIDKLPDGARKGLGYFGRRDGFMVYVDEHCASLKARMFIAKTLFTFFCFSLVIGVAYGLRIIFRRA